MFRSTRVILGFTVLAGGGLFAPAHAQQAAASDLSRAAKGDLTQHGGARRINGDITAAYRYLSNDGEVRNVILHKGDGKGDSEITIARN